MCDRNSISKLKVNKRRAVSISLTASLDAMRQQAGPQATLQRRQPHYVAWLQSCKVSDKGTPSYMNSASLPSKCQIVYDMRCARPAAALSLLQPTHLSFALHHQFTSNTCATTTAVACYMCSHHRFSVRLLLVTSDSLLANITSPAYGKSYIYISPHITR